MLGFGFLVPGSRFRVPGSGFRVSGLEFRVPGEGETWAKLEKFSRMAGGQAYKIRGLCFTFPGFGLPGQEFRGVGFWRRACGAWGYPK